MDTDSLIKELSSGVTVLTQGRRLKRHLEDRYDRRMLGEARSKGFKGWPGASVASFSAWISELYKESFPVKPLLTETRSKTLWSKVVKENLPKRYAPLFRDALSRESYSAYKRLTEYMAVLPDSDFYLTEESKALKGWIKAYETEVSRLGAVSPCALRELVAGLIRDGDVRLPEKIILAGFTGLTPSLKMIVDAMMVAGVEVVKSPPEVLGEGSDGDRIVKILSFSDMESEVAALSRWARATLKPGERLAVVAPKLDIYREAIERDFSSELYPESVLPAELLKDSGSRIYDISLSTTLSESSIAASALDILRIGLWRVDTKILFKVLLDPYFSRNREEYHLLAGADRTFREKNILSASLGDVIYAIKTGGGRGGRAGGGGDREPRSLDDSSSSAPKAKNMLPGAVIRVVRAFKGVFRRR